MSPETQAAAAPEGAFVGRERFRQCVREGLHLAAAQGSQELMLFDTDFQDWPLDDRAVLDSLQTWAQRGQKLTLLAQRYDEVPRRHPQFVRWRQQWAHKIEARQCRQADLPDVASIIWLPGWCLLRHDARYSAGQCSASPAAVQTLREQLTQALTRSSPAFAAYTLGL